MMVAISVGFAGNMKVLLTLINRPNMALHIWSIGHPIKSLRDPKLVVETTYEQPTDIMKGRPADTIARESN